MGAAGAAGAKSAACCSNSCGKAAERRRMETMFISRFTMGMTNLGKAGGTFYAGAALLAERQCKK